jgi:dihydroorotase
VTVAPLRILGQGGGTLAAGKPADLCLFDAQQRWRVEPAALMSQGKNTPLLGQEVQAKVRYTLVNGAVVYDSTLEKSTLRHHSSDEAR